MISPEEGKGASPFKTEYRPNYEPNEVRLCKYVQADRIVTFQ